MKKFIAITMILILTGCGILTKNKGVIGKASVAENKAKDKIEMVDTSFARNNVARLDRIGEFSYGVNIALQKTNGVNAAKNLNERVQSLANQPSLNAMKEMQAIVSQLLSNNTTLLEEKDILITYLNKKNKDLTVQKEDAINSYIKLADKVAAQDDQYKATLNQMDSFLGLGAIWYGLKHLVVRLSWILGIGSILFLVLRFASMSNPIAGAVFQVFNVIGSWLVHTIAAIFPKALAIAGNVSTKLFDAYKGTMTKIVDAVQMAKNNATVSGKEPSVKDVIAELEKTMNTDEKAIVDEIKKGLNW